MCRHYGFRANERTKVECTLVHAQNALLAQSRRDVRGNANAHGWGVAVYNHEHPEVERRATAAYEDMEFNDFAARLYAKTVVAHIRQATVGGPSLSNTHPFVYGCWSFCHNGTVTGFVHLREQMIHETDPALRAFRLGTTDSEQLFYWLLSRMQAGGISADHPCENLDALVKVIAESMREIVSRCHQASPDRPPKLNLLLADGENLLATRWENSLYWNYHDGLANCEYCGVPHVKHRPGIEYRAVAVASEPISHEPWHEVPEHSVLSVGPDIHPRVEKVADGRS
jgi:glutamine amidotransferase